MSTVVSGKIDVQENVSLSEYTTFSVGGPARYFVPVSSEEEAAQALAFAREKHLALFVLGGGSNVLISDEGFQGLVILNRIKGFTYDETCGNVFVSAGGGEDWQEFTDRCVDMGWQGIECLAGIPGTVGASPVQNIGAYGQEVSQVITQVRCLETATGKAVVFSNAECAFSYRESIFNNNCKGDYLVTSVTYKLVKGGAPVVNYRELEEMLSSRPKPNVGDVRDAVIAIRDGKGLIVRTGYETFKSAGSFFKNPVVENARFEEIDAIVAGHGGYANWAWPLPSGEVKISAACLIQCSGFERGYCLGNTGISPRHTLILINRGEASAREIIDFAAEVQRRVLDRFGVLLIPETRLLGFRSPPLKDSP